MNHSDEQLCEAVLSPGEEIAHMSWVKVERNGALLLALPFRRKLALATLNLYQPQKRKGRCLRAALKALIVIGLHRFLPKLELKIGDQGILAQLDVQIDITEVGFLLGNPEAEMRNLIALCEINKRLCVLKVAHGRASEIVKHEYQSMERFAEIIAGVPACMGLIDFKGGAAYFTEFVTGYSPQGPSDDQAVCILLADWLEHGLCAKVVALKVWEKLIESLDAESYFLIEDLADLEILAPVMHGDFAPWNIKMNAHGDVKVMDWEFADDLGMPGWDIIHYHIQRMTLIEGKAADDVIALCKNFLASNEMMGYFSKAGLIGQEDKLLGSYLYYTGRVQSYPREDLIKVWEGRG